MNFFYCTGTEIMTWRCSLMLLTSIGATAIETEGARYYDEKSRQTTFREGQLVWLFWPQPPIRQKFKKVMDGTLENWGISKSFGSENSTHEKEDSTNGAHRQTSPPSDTSSCGRAKKLCPICLGKGNRLRLSSHIYNQTLRQKIQKI